MYIFDCHITLLSHKHCAELPPPPPEMDCNLLGWGWGEFCKTEKLKETDRSLIWNSRGFFLGGEGGGGGGGLEKSLSQGRREVWIISGATHLLCFSL